MSQLGEMRKHAGGLYRKALRRGARPVEKLERSALAAVVAHAELLSLLSELPPEDFEVDQYRRIRNHLVHEGTVPDDLSAVLAELEMRADLEAIDPLTGRQLILRMRERHLERQLVEASPEALQGLQLKLAEVREEIRAFA